MTLHTAPLSLRNLVSSVHRMLIPSVKKNVQFTFSCHTSNVNDWVLGDYHRIQQVLTNVVTNAIKYTTSGSIELTASWKDNNIRFECNDTGPGIPKGDQEKLFQRFTKRGGAPGTGLGLAIAKHLVDLSGGNIRFESDPSIRAGTSCVIVMPLPKCEPPEDNADSGLGMSVIQEPIRVLIVDDVKINRTMLKRRILKGVAPNAAIVEAATGEEALQICDKDQFEVIIVDQYMEEAGGAMLGTDVCFALRRMKVASLLIGCSGNDLEDDFKEAGADCVWKKPMPSNGDIIRLWKGKKIMKDRA